MVIKVGGCAGHGGYKSLNPKAYATPGKRTPDGIPEWELNNEVIKAFEAEIKTYEGVQFIRYDDRTGKTDVPLKTRTDKANRDGVDYYVSFHHNALKGEWGNHTGTETFTQEGVKDKDTLEFAKALHKGAVRAYGLKDRGMKTEDFHITRETKMPGALVEGAYMDSRIDIKKLKDKKVLQNAGKQMAIEFAKYKKLKKKVQSKPVSKPVSKPTPKPVNKEIHRVQVGAFSDRKNAEKLASELKKKGYDVIIK